MKKWNLILAIGAILFSAGCAYNQSTRIPMVPDVGEMITGKPIALEASLLITDETRGRIFKSPSYPDNRLNFAYYYIEPYQLPIGEAFEEACLKIFSQVFQKVTLIRTPEEAKNYPVVIEPKLTDFSLHLSYTTFNYRIYDSVVDGWCTAKVLGTLINQGRPIWQKTIETPLETQRWVYSNYWTKDHVAKLASDTMVLALKELAVRMVKESQGPPPPMPGWLEGIEPTGR